MAISAALGGTLGGVLGSLAGPGGTAIGTAIGSQALPALFDAGATALGARLEAAPALMVTDAERENKRRLAQLKRMQEMGALGLTEAEKQNLYTGAQSAAAGQMNQAQNLIRAAGASGMGGAGAEQLRAAQGAEALTGITAGISRDVESKDLARQRQLENEIQERIAIQSQYDREKVAAKAGIKTAGLQAGIERIVEEGKIQGEALTPGEIGAFAKLRGISNDEASSLLTLFQTNPELARFASLTGGAK